MPQIIEIGWHSTKLLQKHKGAVFFETQCVYNKQVYRRPYESRRSSKPKLH